MVLQEKVEIHDELNPILWNGDKLKEEVHSRLMEIVEEFQEFVSIPIHIIDVYLLGSNAQYNYTEHSDLDLHLITNFATNEMSDDIAEALYNYEKASFNTHYDIDIKGIPVELYVQDVKAMNASKGVYSLYRDEWVIKPEKELEPPELDDDKIDLEYSELEKEVEIALASNKSSDVADMIDKIYLMRRESLAIDGEYGVGNQVFKKLRNNNYLDKLKDRMYELRSDELSLENLQRR